MQLVGLAPDAAAAVHPAVVLRDFGKGSLGHCPVAAPAAEQEQQQLLLRTVAAQPVGHCVSMELILDAAAPVAGSMEG